MNFKKIIPFFIAISVFLIVSLVYFSPVLEGKKIAQSDIKQFIGMSKEIVDHRAENKEEPYWTNATFGGMPSYQLSTYYPNDYIKKIDSVLRFLPRPADYLFLYFLGFFVLLLILKVDYKLAILGSLAFGFSTYFIIILGVGHNAKAHAIAYMPMVLAGILWVFQKKYLIGFLLTAFAMALEINASHPQMTYYLLFMVLILGIVFLIDAVKKRKELPHFFKSIGVLAVAVILAVGVNATSLLATKEYAKYSTRGKSELTIKPDGSKKEITSGLSKDYITEYSYGKFETFDLFIPRFMGGANHENLGTDSHLYRFLNGKIDPRQAKQFSEGAPTYWGSQPIVAAPAYVGAISIFLFVLGLFLLKGKLKHWLVAATVFSILMSWGKNFSVLTGFFINYVPLYNKFRAVSSIQVILELAVPLLGVLALKELFSKEVLSEKKIKALKYSTMLTAGVALLFTVAGGSLFSFEGLNDAYYNNMLNGLADAVVADRKEIFFEDSLRTFIFVVLAAGILWMFVKGKIKQTFVIFVLGGLILFDMVGVAKRYVNNTDFVKASQVDRPYKKSAIDKEILKDKGHYRVGNYMGSFMNDGATSYFHKSIGGYHAAKPGRYQELYDFHLSKNNIEVLNMLNTKYIIFPTNENKSSLQVNSEANGNAWFVDRIKFVESADEEIVSLADFKSKETAVINKNEFAEVLGEQIERDSTATIQLLSYKANELVYESNAKTKQLVVFSEMYYKDGWNAYVDGVLTDHIRANYVLRAMVVPEGKHSIEFKFEPEVIKTGNTITLSSYLLLLVIPAVWYFTGKKNQSKE